MTRPSLRNTDLYVTSGQLLSGKSFFNTFIQVEQGSTIAVDALRSVTQVNVGDGGSAMSINVDSGGYLSGGGSVLSHDAVYAGGTQVEGSYEYNGGITAKAIDTSVMSGDPSGDTIQPMSNTSILVSPFTQGRVVVGSLTVDNRLRR